MADPISKDQLIESLNKIEPKDAQVALVKIYQKYLNPAFGALPKKEIEILMFQVLQELKIFSDNPSQYSMLSSLRMSRPKARNLLYESKLRQEPDLEAELLEILKKPILLKDDDKVCLEIDNPLLVDHLKHILRKEKHITDGSFSPDLVKLTPDAYKSLLNVSFGEISKRELNEALVACGAKKNLTVKSVLTGVLKKVGSKVADDIGDEAGELVGDYLGDLFTSGLDVAKDFLKENLKKDIELKKL